MAWAVTRAEPTSTSMDGSCHVYILTAADDVFPEKSRVLPRLLKVLLVSGSWPVSPARGGCQRGPCGQLP
jgi:hypothetical protein